MKKIGIIGYGALGRQIEKFLCESQNQSALQFFYFDDLFHEAGNANAFPFAAFRDSKFADLSFYIGLGYKHLATRHSICKEVLQSGKQLPSLIHPSSYVNLSATIGEGVYIYPMCNVDQEVEIKTGTILNNTVTVSHNSIVNDCSFLAPGVVLAGQVNVGKYCFLGAGTVVANGVIIGDKAMIGLASSVTRNMESNTCAIGNPMKILSTPFQLV